jgi:hypothetical protein
MNRNFDAFAKIVTHPLKFRLFLLSKLPSAYFSGVRVRQLEPGMASVSIPYKWFSRNPFRSTYFACLGMAAEMSTGVLAMAHLYGLKPPVSMLVVRADAEYFKKATGLTTFTCADGLLIGQAIADAVESGEGKKLTVKAIGTNESKEVVAEFFITWSFKQKSEKIH